MKDVACGIHGGKKTDKNAVEKPEEKRQREKPRSKC
jgi:hypothetical protein